MSHRLCATLLAAATVLVAACGSDDDGDTTPTAPVPTTAATSVAPTASPPLEGEVIEDAYSTEQVFPQLDYDRMIEFALIPGDDEHAVVITQPGMAYRFSLVDEAAEPTVFLDLTDEIIDGADNEEGLLGIAFSPDYATDRRFYVAYSAGPPRQNTLARYSANGDAGDPASGEILLAIDDPFGNHNGGGLEFGLDGLLYMALGDGGSGGDPLGNGQNTDTLLGKILRLDVSGATGYTIPSDNPFVAGAGSPEIFAFGFRNPWRISFDREAGDLWTGDVGQGTREEVNLVTSGGNYGWNIMEGDLCFEPPDGCSSDGLVMPRATYATSGDNCAVTGGYVYRGSELPELQGWYVYGDYCSGVVWALDTEDQDAEPVRLMDTDFGLPSFGQDADGELYLITFDGSVQKLVRE